MQKSSKSLTQRRSRYNAECSLLSLYNNAYVNAAVTKCTQGNTKISCLHAIRSSLIPRSKMRVSNPNAYAHNSYQLAGCTAGFCYMHEAVYNFCFNKLFILLSTAFIYSVVVT